jgi:hypothetical protein
VLACAFALGAGAFAMPREARAQDRSATYTETHVDSGTAIIFEEDLAHGSTLGASGSTLIVPSRAFRMGLVRPRLHFVSEMLKSVEAL